MSLWQAVVLGVVEGLTEFLPVSSTGHLILASRLLNLSPGEFLRSFEIIIQSGAILAVAVLYGRRLLTDRKTFSLVTVAFLPTAAMGFIFYKAVKMLLGSPQVVLLSFFIGGVVLILFERMSKKSDVPAADVSVLTYRQAAVIGLCQSAALVPGVSRSAATIIGGLALGIPRRTIVEFSFLLALPTLLAATGLDLIKHAGSFSSDHWILLAAGAGMSFVVALASIRWFLGFIGSRRFTVFGVYRIAAAVFFWILG